MAPQNSEITKHLKAMPKPKPNSNRTVKTKTTPSQQVAELFGQGFAAHQQGQMVQAEAMYQQVLAMQPGHFDALHLSGVIAGQNGDHKLAVERITKALKTNASNAAAHNNLANSLQALGRREEALVSYDQAIGLKPNYAEAYSNKGNVLKEQQKFDAALESYDRALELNPHHVGALNNKGVSLANLNRLEEALISYNQSLALKPDHVDALNNKGLALADLHRLDEALISYDQAIALNPDYTDAYWNKSLVLLIRGEYSQGWLLYETRWQSVMKNRKLNYQQPLWLGEEPLVGKTILLVHEQGFGDALQFCRYAGLVKALGARVLLVVPPELQVLMGNLAGVDAVLIASQTLPAFDYYCPLLSLPLAFKTTLASIPNKTPYLFASAAKQAQWGQWLQAWTKAAPRLRVGLVWTGITFSDQPGESAWIRRRNMSLEQIAHINQPDIEFVSLQKGAEAEEELASKQAQYWPDGNLLASGGALKDFADTAGLLMHLDLLISVDTSTAHLAAALGKPVWLLNRFDTCWRWLLDRDDSPWYPTVKIYRQEKAGDWDSVMQRVAKDLRRFEPVRSVGAGQC